MASVKRLDLLCKPLFCKKIDPFKSLCYCSTRKPVSVFHASEFTFEFHNFKERKRTVVITGFNTDVAHEGVVYHVQTEDKGINSPVILSLVYVGGAILASKRTSYDDLLALGFDESALAERLQHQHKLICAAIRAGRIEDLKRLSERGGPSAPNMAASRSVKTPAGGVLDDDVILEILNEPHAFDFANDKAELDLIEIDSSALTTNPEASLAQQSAPPTQTPVSEVQQPNASAPVASTPSSVAAIPDASSYTVRPVVRGTVLADFARGDAPPGALHLALLNNEEEFRAGEAVTLSIYVGRGEERSEPIPNAPVAIKILGTTFRTLVLNAKTDAQGIALIRTTLPNFTQGRAVMVVQATANGFEAELRRIIQHA